MKRLLEELKEELENSRKHGTAPPEGLEKRIEELETKFRKEDEERRKRRGW